MSRTFKPQKFPLNQIHYVQASEFDCQFNFIFSSLVCWYTLFYFLGVFVLLLTEPSFFRSAMVGDKEVGGDLPTIADDLVVTKYKMAAEIVNSKFLSGLVPCPVLDTLDSDVGVFIT